MNLAFSQSGYCLNPETHVWIRPGYLGIAYSDGDKSEERIAAIIEQATDLKVLSAELRRHCTDWASLYHLASARANILRPFVCDLHGDVLEIGAGCGAVTRYVGECGGNVLALEGSPRRAAICRSRTRDLHNVTVVSDKFDEFKINHKFHIVTLIGVLEYASLFSSSGFPALNMLERALSFLEPDGKLILAIENQLGLKYFAGALEDHLGQPMYGIEGRYRKDEPQTYGRAVISEMFRRAGFVALEFLSPLPDYKFPVSILTEEGIHAKDFDAFALSWQSARRDPQVPKRSSFSLELAWSTVLENRLGIDLANSFLVVASPKNQKLIKENILAYHYSTDRKPEFSKETQFQREASGNITVTYERLAAYKKLKSDNTLVNFVCSDKDSYAFGRPLSLEFVQIITKDGWAIDEIVQFVKRYLDILCDIAREQSIQINPSSPYSPLPGSFFDVVPQNLIIRDVGRIALIDKEWELTSQIEIGHLLFRMLLLSIGTISHCGNISCNTVMTRGRFIQTVLSRLYPGLQLDDYARYMENELQITEQITGRSSKKDLQEWLDQPLQTFNLHRALVEHDKTIASLSNAVSERDAQIATMREQLNYVNAKLLRLEAEFATVGAKIGRRITQLRTSLAPVGTYRAAVVGAGLKFISLATSIGLKGAVITGYRRLSFKVKSGCARALSHDSTKGPGVHPEFAAWIARHEPDQDQLEAQKLETMRFSYRPLLSVIIPVYKLPRTVLVATLNCLLEQTYPNWEACIVWADSEDVAGCNWLQGMTKNDKRFKVKPLEHNAGISNNTNAALELAEGEYVALLDHDDILAPWAFYEVVKLLQSLPQVDFIYSDKDSITADGQTRLNALFKPEWSPEVLHSVNYLTHLNIMRTSLVREIGGWDPETDGAQDWDIFFRVTERTQHIARIPSILYHWRILPTSTATGLQAKPYAAKGQLVAQQKHFIRRGLPAVVMATPEGSFHVRWPIKQNSADVVICQTGSSQQLMHILNLLQAGNQQIIRKLYVLHSIQLTDALETLKHAWGDRLIFVSCNVVDWRNGFKTVAVSNETQTAVLIDGRVSNLSDDLLQELAGWVTQHPEIAWSSAIALSTEDIVYEAGRVVAQNYESAPMFHGSRFTSSGWFGAPFWYRNARAVSPYAVAVNVGDIDTALSAVDPSEAQRMGFSKFCMALTSNGRRGLINPFAKVYFDQSPESNWPNDGWLYHEDPYFNPAFNQVSPLKLHC